jgi:hypothetical protein
MIGGDSQVFVHVKGDDAGPVNLLVGYESGQEFVLTRSRGEHEVGLAGHALAISNLLRYGLSRGAAGQSSILENENLERFDSESSDRGRL